MSERIFADDWRDCLREQYKYVIRQQDWRTEATLIQVLHDVGFQDAELAALRLEATMRAEDMPDDYVPEEIRQQYAAVDEALIEPGDEVSEELEIEEVVTFDELVAEEPAEIIEVDDDEPVLDDDAPQQLSLF